MLFKLFRKIVYLALNKIENIYCVFLFYIHNVQFTSFKTNGTPYISIALGGYCIIGENFKMNNSLQANPIGRNQKCIFFVDKNAELIIGKNVGISAAALIAHKYISIGDNVKIGGGVCIYDTDFHSLNSNERNNPILDKQNKTNEAVRIADNVFIGAHSTILKGVSIGENSIVGACSVVTKNISPNEIWAGNPAKFIKKIENA